MSPISVDTHLPEYIVSAINREARIRFEITSYKRKEN